MAIRVRIPLGSPFHYWCIALHFRIFFCDISPFLMNLTSAIKNLAAHYHITRQALKFIIVGIGSTIISYSTFIFFLHQLGIHYLIANIAGFSTSIGFSYQCNKRWTFKAGSNQHFTHYILLYLTALILSSLLLRFFVEVCGIIPEIANILTILINAIFNFLGVKFLVFKK